MRDRQTGWDSNLRVKDRLEKVGVEGRRLWNPEAWAWELRETKKQRKFRAVVGGSCFSGTSLPFLGISMSQGPMSTAFALLLWSCGGQMFSHP